jgi:hypothetical protein
MKIVDHPYYFGLTTDSRTELARSSEILSGNPYYAGLIYDGDVRLENTAESLADFIFSVGRHHNLEILTPDSEVMLTTSGIWINKCADKEFLAELKKVLIPKQNELAREWGFPELPLH